MSGFFGKLKDFVIPPSEEFDEYDDLMDMPGETFSDGYDAGSEPTAMDRKDAFRSQSDADLKPKSGSSASNVVGMPGASRFWGSAAAEVLVMEPRAFEEMPQVIQALRERKSVVLNLSLMEPAQAQRAVDFVAGATFTIDGHQERVGENIFLFTPNCVQVRTQSGVTHEVSQVNPSRIATTSWQTDPVLSHIAQ
ncbi:MAG: cell division protein SepF [Thermosynechococcaceae cyanobacterium]